jgi:hypothetical protein
VDRAPARFGDDLLRDQETELDPDSGEADPLAAGLRRGRDVVVAGELAAPHALAIVDDGQRGGGRVRREGDPPSPGVERIGHDLGEDRLLDGAGIRVAEVLEEMQEVDARLTHRCAPGYRVSTKPAISSTWSPPTAMDGA